MKGCTHSCFEAPFILTRREQRSGTKEDADLGCLRAAVVSRTRGVLMVTQVEVDLQVGCGYHHGSIVLLACI